MLIILWLWGVSALVEAPNHQELCISMKAVIFQAQALEDPSAQLPYRTAADLHQSAH
jgi:hypothetical protein